MVESFKFLHYAKALGALGALGGGGGMISGLLGVRLGGPLRGLGFRVLRGLFFRAVWSSSCLLEP